MSSNDKMREALKIGIIAHLRKVGFKGSLPHFRRVHDCGIDLICFQFHLWMERTRLAVEYGYTGHFQSWQCDPESQRTVTEKNVTVWDLDYPNYRGRLNPSNLLGEPCYADYWFEFEEGHYAECDAEIREAFPIAELWFKRMRENPANKDIGFTGTLSLMQRGLMK